MSRDPAAFHYMQLPRGSTATLPHWGLAHSTSGGHILNILKPQHLPGLRRILCSPAPGLWKCYEDSVCRDFKQSSAFLKKYIFKKCIVFDQRVLLEVFKI